MTRRYIDMKSLILTTLLLSFPTLFSQSAHALIPGCSDQITSNHAVPDEVSGTASRVLDCSFGDFRDYEGSDNMPSQLFGFCEYNGAQYCVKISGIGLDLKDQFASNTTISCLSDGLSGTYYGMYSSAGALLGFEGGSFVGTSGGCVLKGTSLDMVGTQGVVGKMEIQSVKLR